MQITVRFFATLRDRAGMTEVSLDLPAGATVAELTGLIATQYPALAPALPSSIISINEEFAFSDQVIQAGDRAAIFPPVSGGSDERRWPEFIAVTSEALDLDAVLAGITLPETGGICTFTGAVRGLTSTGGNQTGETAELFYEAYASMAEAKLRQVAAEIRERYPQVQGIALAQRVGRLAVGEMTVLVACAGAHRDAGIFEAARYGIDRLKQIVPVWKQEIRPDGGTSWKEGDYLPSPEDRRSPGDSRD